MTRKITVLTLGAMLFALSLPVAAQQPAKVWRIGVLDSSSSAAAPQEPITPLPLSVDLDLKRVALGERLFNDVRLSRDNTKSCAACHPLDQGGMDGRRSATSANDSSPARNTPTIFKLGFNAFFNWDGIPQTLEAQAEIVLLSPRLMNTTWPELLTRLRADADYVAPLKTAYPKGLTRTTVLAALPTL